MRLNLHFKPLTAMAPLSIHHQTAIPGECTIALSVRYSINVSIGFVFIKSELA